MDTDFNYQRQNPTAIVYKTRVAARPNAKISRTIIKKRSFLAGIVATLTSFFHVYRPQIYGLVAWTILLWMLTLWLFPRKGRGGHPTIIERLGFIYVPAYFLSVIQCGVWILLPQPRAGEGYRVRVVDELDASMDTKRIVWSWLVTALAVSIGFWIAYVLGFSEKWKDEMRRMNEPGEIHGEAEYDGDSDGQSESSSEAPSEAESEEQPDAEEDEESDISEEIVVKPRQLPPMTRARARASAARAR